MSLPTTKVHHQFKINGLRFSATDLLEVGYSLIKEGEAFEQEVGDFLMDWLSDEATIAVKTSGSTGIPKSIHLKKEYMVNSARSTGEFFGMGPGTTALMCLPAHTIAGKMMLVRAMVLGWDLQLVKPSSRPLANTNRSYDICAMVPLQMAKSIEELHQVGTILVGGAAVSSEIKEQLIDIPVNVYESYGMTETCSHIALKRIGSETSDNTDVNDHFTTLKGITIESDDRGCMVINASSISNKPVITNDLVDCISATEFNWLGRWDNVINSGGIKLIPETIEKKLESLISERYVILGQADEELGERVVLVVEGEVEKEKLSDAIRESKELDPFEKPRAIFSLTAFDQTSGGKPIRKKILEKINEA